MTYIGTTINESAVIVLQAGTDIENPQGIALSVDTNGKAVLPSAGANAIGIALFSNDPVSVGSDINIQIKEIGKMVAAEAINVGDEISVNAAGKAVKAKEGDFILGIALTKASAAGSIFEIQITKSGYKPA